MGRKEKVNATRTSPSVDIPPELINEVLSRLPAKSIGRFRCACKQWHTLLYDVQFFKLQFSRKRDDDNKLISICKLSPNSSLFNYVDISIGNGGNVVAIEKTQNFKHNDRSYTIHGSYNGLLLLSERMSGLFIVNPITSETRQINIPSCIDRNNLGDDYGFGYDSCNDDYIVVIILRGNIDNYRITPRTVYMFKRNSWKKVEDCPCYDQYSDSAGVFVNGAIHWLGCRISETCRVICAFDLADEKFREVELPNDELKRKTLYFPEINVVGGCLCMLFFCDKKIELWVMKEYGVKESWTKYSMMCHWLMYYSTKTLLLWDGDAFVVMTRNEELFLCNLKDKTLKEIEVQGVRVEARCGHVWTFVESLFSPNCINGIKG